MGVLDGTEIMLDGRIYRLLREELANRMSKRRWQVEKKRMATKRVPRADTRPGEMEGDYIVTWGDWSKGICGDQENLIGCLHYAEGAHGLVPGTLRPAWVETYAPMDVSSTEQGHSPAKIQEFNGIPHLAMGRYIYRYYNGTLSLQRDLGADFIASDAAVHNTELLIACTNAAGHGTNRAQKSSTGSIWTTSADVLADATFYANVEARLWKTTMVLQLANIGPTDNPMTGASWSAPIPVGTLNSYAMALIGYGERVVGVDAIGFYPGDRAAIFPNVLGRPLTSYRDGKRSISRGSDLFYIHENGIFRWNSSSVEEVGIQQHFPNADPRDQLPGMAVSALTHDGYYLWAATAVSGYPRAEPTGVKLTQNNGAAYTDLVTNTTDSDLGTTVTVTGLDTLANGDYLLIGFSAPFYGIEFLGVIQGSGIVSTITASYVTAAGPPVVATTLPVTAGFYDDTRNRVPTDGYVPLFSGGYMAWNDTGSDLAGWAPVNIGGTTAYWMRLTTSALMFDRFQIAELRVHTQPPRAHIWRGRPWRPGDVRNTSLIWEPYTHLQGGIRPTAISVSSAYGAETTGNGALLVAAKQYIWSLRRGLTLHTPGIMDYPGGGRVISAKHDGGMPEITKEWLNLRVKGRTIDATHTVTVEYRLDETNAWTTAGTITSSPGTLTLTGAVSYSFQWRLTFNAFRSDVCTEVNEVEIDFRERAVWKQEGSYLLEIADGASASISGMLPDSDVQLTRLEALHGGAAVMLRDATARLQRVNVTQLRQLEVFQEALDQPVLAVEVTTREV